MRLSTKHGPGVERAGCLKAAVRILAYFGLSTRGSSAPGRTTFFGRTSSQPNFRHQGGSKTKTIEYAIGTIAAAAFGAILYTVVTGDSIVSALTNIIGRALNTKV